VARNVALPLAGVDLDLAGDFVEFTVSDTGVGIPEDILPKVLDPFFTTKEANKGTGLGLSQVYGFVQQSGGRMTVRSELGHGVTIAMYLPRTTARPAAPAGTRAPAIIRRLEILCVEDNPQVAEVAAGLLEQMGHGVRMASSAAAALQMLDEGERPDLVFSDIVMAGEMDGLALARHIRREWPQTPILLATGYSREAQAIGAEFPILTKPYQSAELSDALSAACRLADEVSPARDR
jgi:CheY-like chemotaxis protein